MNEILYFTCKNKTSKKLIDDIYNSLKGIKLKKNNETIEDRIDYIVSFFKQLPLNQYKSVQTHKRLGRYSESTIYTLIGIIVYADVINEKQKVLKLYNLELVTKILEGIQLEGVQDERYEKFIDTIKEIIHLGTKSGLKKGLYKKTYTLNDNLDVIPFGTLSEGDYNLEMRIKELNKVRLLETDLFEPVFRYLVNTSEKLFKRYKWIGLSLILLTLCWLGIILLGIHLDVFYEREIPSYISKKYVAQYPLSESLTVVIGDFFLVISIILLTIALTKFSSLLNSLMNDYAVVTKIPFKKLQRFKRQQIFKIKKDYNGIAFRVMPVCIGLLLSFSIHNIYIIDDLCGWCEACFTDINAISILNDFSILGLYHALVATFLFFFIIYIAVFIYTLDKNTSSDNIEAFPFIYEYPSYYQKVTFKLLEQFTTYLMSAFIFLASYGSILFISLYQTKIKHGNLFSWGRVYIMGMSIIFVVIILGLIRFGRKYSVFFNNFKNKGLELLNEQEDFYKRIISQDAIKSKEDAITLYKSIKNPILNSQIFMLLFIIITLFVSIFIFFIKITWFG